VAYTLSTGRKAFKHRRMLVCQNAEQATTALRTLDPSCVLTHFQEPQNRPIVFMFSGQGAQYVNMGWELYQTEPIFQEQVDKCSEYLKPFLGRDLRLVLYPELLYSPFSKGVIQTAERAISEQEATELLTHTAIAQPALFVIEYALAQLWMAWGVHPEAMIGHSIGEYVAACLSEVFSLEEALSLVALRGKMMQEMPDGAMLSVPLAEKEVQPLLSKGLSLAAVNTPSVCVVSGPTEAIAVLQTQLTEQNVACRRLHTSDSPFGQIHRTGKTSRTVCAQNPLPVQPHRHLDYRQGSDQSQLLGKTFAIYRAFCRRATALITRTSTHLDRNRPRPNLNDFS